MSGVRGRVRSYVLYLYQYHQYGECGTLSWGGNHGVQPERLPPRIITGNLLGNDAVRVGRGRVVGGPVVVGVVALVGFLALRLLPLHVAQNIPLLLLGQQNSYYLDSQSRKKSFMIVTCFFPFFSSLVSIFGLIYFPYKSPPPHNLCKL